jgi:hypothetical protein
MRLKDMLGFGDDGQAQAVEPPRAAAPPPIIESDPLAAEEPADAPEFVDESEPESESAGETTADTVEPRYLAAEFVLDSAVLQSKGQPLRRTMVDPPAHAEETPVDETEAEDLEPVVAPPLAGRILPMPAPAAAAASLPMTLAAEEIYTLATSVTNFGVPPSQSSIIRATLIDLGRQLETPPVHWASLRDSVAFAMEYPELARRLLPLVLPYLQQAA